MKKRVVMTSVGVVALVFTLSVRTAAFLGFGDIVFDPSVFGQMVQQLIHMEQQYEQLVRSYEMARNQYNHMRQMARQIPVDMNTRYRAVASRWQPSSATDTYGTTMLWNNTINTGSGFAAAYAAATEALGTYGAALRTVPADQLDRLKRSYGTVERTDAAVVSAIRTIGRLRGNSGSAESAIQRLEDDSLSSDPAMNTEVAVLNKINAAGVLALRNTQDTNKLLVALAERDVLTAIRERDAETRAINQHIRFVSEGKAVTTAQARGASQAMLDWRMP
jgi:hypothetical protein